MHCQKRQATSLQAAKIDDGEWQLLKSLELSHNMPVVFAEKWQRKLRKQTSEETRENRLAQSINEGDLARAQQVRKWLINHPNKKDIIST